MYRMWKISWSSTWRTVLLSQFFYTDSHSTPSMYHSLYTDSHNTPSLYHSQYTESHSTLSLYHPLYTDSHSTQNLNNADAQCHWTYRTLCCFCRNNWRFYGRDNQRAWWPHRPVFFQRLPIFKTPCNLRLGSRVVEHLEILWFSLLDWGYVFQKGKFDFFWYHISDS